MLQVSFHERKRRKRMKIDRRRCIDRKNSRFTVERIQARPSSSLVPSFLFFFLQLCACGILGAGLWLRLAYSGYTTLVPHYSFASADSLLLAAGCVTFVIAFFGCCGAWFQSRCMLITVSSYFLFLSCYRAFNQLFLPFPAVLRLGHTHVPGRVHAGHPGLHLQGTSGQEFEGRAAVRHREALQSDQGTWNSSRYMGPHTHGGRKIHNLEKILLIFSFFFFLAKKSAKNFSSTAAACGITRIGSESTLGRRRTACPIRVACRENGIAVASTPRGVTRSSGTRKAARQLFKCGW